MTHLHANNKKTLIKCLVTFTIFCFATLNATATNPIDQKKLTAIMQSFCAQDTFSGAVLIAKGNTIIFEHACGLANRSFNIPNTLHTVFNLGSVGKLFTAVAIAQLTQQDKISLTTPVEKIIPSWLPDNPAAKQVTISQLLTHSSGLGNYMDDPRWKSGADSGLYVAVNDYQPIIHDSTFLFSPGSSQAYSNNGYILLGAIIEKVTHQNYTDYLQKNIFTPADMKNTNLYRQDDVVPNQAVGYTYHCDKGKCAWRNNYFSAPFASSPAGGTYSTVEDLFKFSQALHQRKLLNEALTKQVLDTTSVTVTDQYMTKRVKIRDVTIPEKMTQYGFAGSWNTWGFAVWENPALLGHTGGGAGTSALFATSSDNAVTIIILSNVDGPGPILLYKKIRATLGWSADISSY